jgi:hypothetical protein
MSRTQRLLLFMLIPLLSSCQVAGVAVQAVTGSIGCSVNDNPTANVQPGSTRDITLNLSLNDAGKVIELNETAVCEYQGSMCAGGKWYSVWYGDPDITHTIHLSDDNQLVFKPHNFCIQIHDYEEQCAAGNCSASEQFMVKLHYSKAVQEQRKAYDLDWKQGELTEFSLVNGEKLVNYGYDLSTYHVVYGDLKPASTTIK